MQIQQKIGRPRRTPPPRLISARPHTARLLPKIRSAKKKRSACCSAHRDDSSNVGHDGVQVHDLRRRERRTPRKSRWGAAGCLARRYKDQRNARAGAIYGCRGGARRWGWDLCMHGSRAPCVKGCHSQLWARKGAGGYARWPLCTSPAAGGRLSTTIGRNPQLDGRGGTAKLMPNE